MFKRKYLVSIFIVAIFAISPILATLIGVLLVKILGCNYSNAALSARDCYLPIEGFISALVPMGWLVFFTVPIGFFIIAFIFIVMALDRVKKNVK